MISSRAVPQPPRDLRGRLPHGGGELVDVRIAPVLPGDGDAGVDGAGLDRRRNGREPGRHLAVLGGVAARARRDQQATQLRRRGRTFSGAVHEPRTSGIERADLRGRQPGEDRPAGRGEVRGQANADVRDERRSPRCTLLDHVQDVGTLQHDEVCGLPDPVDEAGQGDSGEPGQRLLPREPVADLPRRKAHAPGAVVGVVHDEVLIRHRPEQVIRRGSGSPTPSAIRAAGSGTGWPDSRRSTRSAEVAAGTGRLMLLLSRIRDSSATMSLPESGSGGVLWSHGRDRRRRAAESRRCGAGSPRGCAGDDRAGGSRGDRASPQARRGPGRV